MEGSSIWSSSEGATDLCREADSADRIHADTPEDQLLPLASLQYHSSTQTSPSQLLHDSGEALASSSNPTTSHSILRDPNFLDLVRSSDVSTIASGFGFARSNQHRDVESLEPKDFSTGADSANDNNLTESISSAQLGRSEFFASVDHRNRTAEAISLEELIQNTLRSSASASEALRQFTVHRLSSYLADLPPDWKAMGLYSAFLVNYSKTELALPEGKMSIEPKVFEAGFNTRLCTRSLRLYPDKPPPMVRYKLHGSHRQFAAFMGEETVHMRGIAAWSVLVDVMSESSYVFPLSPGFEKLAADFFNGNTVHDADYYESISDAKQENELESGPQDQTLLHGINYVITYYQGDWSEILRGDVIHRDSVLAIFLQDLIMNNELEESVRRRSPFQGLVVREQTQLIKAAERDLSDEAVASQRTVSTTVDQTNDPVTDTTNTSADKAKSIVANTHFPSVVNESNDSFSNGNNGSKKIADNTGHLALDLRISHSMGTADSLAKDEPMKINQADGKTRRKRKKNKGKSKQVPASETASDTKCVPSGFARSSSHKPSEVGTSKEDQPGTSDQPSKQEQPGTSDKPPDDEEGGAWSVVQSKSSRKSSKLTRGLGKSTSSRHASDHLAGQSFKDATTLSNQSFQMNPPQQPSRQSRKYGTSLNPQGPHREQNTSTRKDAHLQKSRKSQATYKPALNPTMGQTEKLVANMESVVKGVEKNKIINSDEFSAIPSKASASPTPAEQEVSKDVEEPHHFTASLCPMKDASSDRGTDDNSSKGSGSGPSHHIPTSIKDVEDGPHVHLAAADGVVDLPEVPNEPPPTDQDFQHSPNASYGGEHDHVMSAGRASIPTGNTDNHCAQDSSLSHMTENMEAGLNLNPGVSGQTPGASYTTSQYVDQTSGTNVHNSDGHNTGIRAQPDSHPTTNFPTATEATDYPHPRSLPGHEHQQRGTVPMESSYSVKEPSNEVNERPRHQAPDFSPVPYNCTYCQERTIASNENPVFLCSGCGPYSNIRYCSIACLLADAYGHSQRCTRLSASERYMTHDIPEPTYEPNSIVPLSGYDESAERFRQRAFSVYCSSGDFPRLFMAWAKKFNYTRPQSFDVSESFKRTGEYAVFKSRATGPAQRSNPHADVIYTIKLFSGDPKKEALKRTLNACFLLFDVRIVEFLFRLIRYLILNKEYFEFFKYSEKPPVVFQEFQHQFWREFNFDATMQSNPSDVFNFDREWEHAEHLVEDLERKHPVLQPGYGH